MPNSLRLAAVAPLTLFALALLYAGPTDADHDAPPQRGALVDGDEPFTGHEGRFENIDRREAASSSLTGRSVLSGRLFGTQSDPEQALTAAREKLLNARQRHQRAVVRAETTAAAPPTAPEDESGSWPHRLEMSQHRILVAQANLQIYDKAYADMLHDDYPRGQARQDLIDSRERAVQRLEAEKAKLPMLVERAREAGVSQSLLLAYEVPN